MVKTPHKSLALAILLTAVIAFSLNSAYAQTETATAEPIPELVDGISTTVLIAIIAVTGIGLQTYKGMIGKKRGDFNINELIFTFIVGVGSAIILLGNAFQNISVNMNSPELMIFLVQQILTVMGAKGAIDIGKKFAAKTRNTPELPAVPEPMDDEDDLPPGKSGINEVAT